MRFLISKSLKSVISGDSLTFEKVQFNLTPKEFDFLEIDSGYVVCNEKLLRVKKLERQAVVVSLDIVSAEQISLEEKSKHSIGNGNVGYGIFLKEKETSEECFPPILIIRLFLSQDILARVFAYNTKANVENSIDIDFSNVSFGWEPDGSHYIWISSDGELSVKNVRLDFLEMDKTEQQLDDEEEKFWDERDDNKKDKKKSSIEETLVKVQYAMYLLVFLAAFHFLRNLN